MLWRGGSPDHVESEGAPKGSQRNKLSPKPLGKEEGLTTTSFYEPQSAKSEVTEVSAITSFAPGGPGGAPVGKECGVWRPEAGSVV